MIFQLLNSYQRSLALTLLLLFYCSFATEVYANSHIPSGRYYPESKNNSLLLPSNKAIVENYINRGAASNPPLEKVSLPNEKSKDNVLEMPEEDNGGPSKPEANSFKSVSANDLVNLFTGSFSYNIPLMDVGGYPINMFYSGGVGMEDEASWVGLGWNINPGTINRNMRGIPDDFNGDDSVKQTMVMKPNITVGASVGGAIELLGIKTLRPNGTEVGLSFGMGVLFNNYLGPALERNIGLNLTYAMNVYSASEKDGKVDSTSLLNRNLSIGANLGMSSRSGTTLSPSLSFTAKSFQEDRMVSFGVGIGTAYNSRTGIKALNLFEQTSFNTYSEKNAVENYLSSANKQFGMSMNLHNTTISFAKGSYMPALRMPVSNTSTSGSFQLGAGMFGLATTLHARMFKQKSEVEQEDRVQVKPLVGFIYSYKAMENRDAVMDFTRLNDREVTPNTSIISAPQYTYDIFSISGERTGGVIRAYLKDMGTMRDNYSQTKDKSLSFSLDFAPPGHYGADVNHIKTPSSIGEWTYGNNIKNVLEVKENSRLSEYVYFRNPGEASVIDSTEYNRIGNADLVRFALTGSGANPAIQSQLERFTDPSGSPDYVSVGWPVSDSRKKRTQVISMLSAAEAGSVGLDRFLRSYSRDSNDFIIADTLSYQQFSRVGNYRKPHHISEINVTEADGIRYVYGQPVYNVVQRDYTFSVSNIADGDGLVAVGTNEMNLTSPHLINSANRDGYLQIIETPAYASNFLLTGILSSDYVDVTGNGITEDDLGSAIKFNYSKSDSTYKWRSPQTRGTASMAHANEGLLSNAKDDKGLVSYGERESWYLHSIESKTMIAIFTLENRFDGKGVMNDSGVVNANGNSLQRLKKIDLYNKSDLNENGVANAKPAKTVWFKYNYSLQKDAPGNTQTGSQNTGKLTLESIYFTYNGQNRAEKSEYVFQYNDSVSYKVNSSDRWGTYKPKTDNPGGINGLSNNIYSYSVQDSVKAANNAKAWNLSKILLPSGAQIEVTYESNDYAYVQNKRAAKMMQIGSIGRGQYAGNNTLYDLVFPGYAENNRVHINVPVACNNREEVYSNYLEGVNQLSFKLAVLMPKGKEYIPVYAKIADYGVGNTPNSIWIELQKVNGHSPLALEALNYLREKLPAQTFPGYDVSDQSGLQAVGNMLVGMLDGLSNAFKDVLKYMMDKGMARQIVLAESFVRLNEPTGKKYGGGTRVKKVVLKDNWDKLAGLYQTEYGNVYDYTTVDNFGGQRKVISSGVASYEPAIGAEENPFMEMVQVADKLPLAPTSYGAIEMPVLDAFFPAPVVGYSKVTVYSLNKFKTPQDKKSRSGVGKQVTEFYTAKDFPVKFKHTLLDKSAEKRFKDQNKIWEFFSSYSMEARAITQGFLVELNDMHGKLKSQSSYSEEDENTPINYSGYYYRNTGINGMEDKFDFAYSELGGEIRKGNMGVDIELMTDTREFLVSAKSFDIQAQGDWISPFPPFWLPVVIPVSGDHSTEYRAVTTTKVVNYRSVLDSLVVIERGSVVSTKNMVYDAETGLVIVSKVNNEFDDPIYSTNYPAYWAYKGMGPAYKNIDALYEGISFRDGRIVLGMSLEEVNSTFESGDELYIKFALSPSDDCGKAITGLYSPVNINKVWALDIKKHTDSININNPDFVFITEDGTFFTAAAASFRIVRSGKRNMLSAQLNTIVSANSPVTTSAPFRILINTESKVINSSAVTYKEIWQNDKDIFKKGDYVKDTHECIYTFIENCTGSYQHVNPYRKGLLGTFRQNKNFVFQSERDLSSITTQLSNLRKDGAIISFVPYWSFDSNKKLVSSSDTRWIWVRETTRMNSRGLESESKNSLDIYTSTQYGYLKNLPISVTTNSKYHEAAYSGFEDEVYEGFINKRSLMHCNDNQFLVQDNSFVVSDASQAVKAHSGKYMARVNAGQTVTLNNNISVDNSFNYDYQLDLSGKDTARSLTQLGFTVDTSYLSTYVGTYNPQNLSNWTNVDFLDNNNNPRLGISFQYTLNDLRNSAPGNTNNVYRIDYQAHQYANVSVDGDYSIVFLLGPSRPQISRYIFITLRIYDANGILIHTLSGNDVDNPSATVRLCKGIYKFHYTVRDDLRVYSPTLGTDVVRTSSLVQITTNISSPSYKSMTSEITCIFSKPIPASEEMMNPGFSLVPGRKMLINGWVNEICGSSQCSYENYTNAKLRMVFRNSMGTIIETLNFSPSGSIIEGWQKIDQVFIIPAGAAKASLIMVNEAASSVITYFDDIRIHPFDAQMNSYVYDPVNLRLSAQHDENNYSTFYDYDEEGNLIRTRVETEKGIKTINESRTHKQNSVKTIQ